MLNPATGVISGVPNGNVGIYEFNVTATDSAAPANSITVPVTLYLEQTNPGLLSFNVTGGALGDALLNADYSFQIVPTGGLPPYTVSVASGSTLPPGLSLVSGAALPGNIFPGYYSTRRKAFRYRVNTLSRWSSPIPMALRPPAR